MSGQAQMRKNAAAFLDEVLVFLRELNIDVSGMVSDHLGLRFKSVRDADVMLNDLLKEAVLLSDAVVNGRKIFIVKLHKPIQYKSFVVPCLEIPYPTDHHDYPDGFEHIEYVVEARDVQNFEQEVKNRFPQITSDVQETYHYKFSIPKADNEQLLNPSFALSKRKGLTVKFHPHSIEEVVRG